MQTDVTRLRVADPEDGARLPRNLNKFLLLSGPNQFLQPPLSAGTWLTLRSSNLFGKRDPKHYGSTTLAQIEEKVTQLGKELGVEVSVATLLNCGEATLRLSQPVSAPKQITRASSLT